jgi:hypothetical protein
MDLPATALRGSSDDTLTAGSGKGVLSGETGAARMFKWTVRVGHRVVTRRDAFFAGNFGPLPAF